MCVFLQILRPLFDIYVNDIKWFSKHTFGFSQKDHPEKPHANGFVEKSEWPRKCFQSPAWIKSRENVIDRSSLFPLKSFQSAWNLVTLSRGFTTAATNIISSEKKQMFKQLSLDDVTRLCNASMQITSLLSNFINYCLLRLQAYSSGCLVILSLSNASRCVEIKQSWATSGK